MRHWGRLLAAASPGGRLIERDGVVAPVLPAVPERSVCNSVAYTTPEGLAAAYDELATAYEEIGAQWTVWVHPGDEEATALLAREGHVLDAEPALMALDLRDGFERPPAGALEEWTAEGDLARVGALNDRSYEFGTDSFARALAEMPLEDVYVYVAHHEGEPAGCVITIDLEANTEVQMVAVVPEARGRGLAGRLTGHALADAAERGRQTSTLIATRLGLPVYERLGYESVGVLQMWERRRSG
jgi:GNAT superfamily N-acetyltransferase